MGDRDEDERHGKERKIFDAYDEQVEEGFPAEGVAHHLVSQKKGLRTEVHHPLLRREEEDEDRVEDDDAEDSDDVRKELSQRNLGRPQQVEGKAKGRQKKPKIERQQAEPDPKSEKGDLRYSVEGMKVGIGVLPAESETELPPLLDDLLADLYLFFPLGEGKLPLRQPDDLDARGTFFPFLLHEMFDEKRNIGDSQIFGQVIKTCFFEIRPGKKIRIAEHLAGGQIGKELSPAEHERAGRILQRQMHIVGDEEDRKPGLLIQLGKELHQSGVVKVILSAGRFIEQQDFRIGDQNRGDRNPLLLAIAERTDRPVVILTQSTEPQHIKDPLPDQGLLIASLPEGERHLVEHQIVADHVVGVLHHKPDQIGAGAGRVPGEVNPFKRYRSAVLA